MDNFQGLLLCLWIIPDLSSSNKPLLICIGTRVYDMDTGFGFGSLFWDQILGFAVVSWLDHGFGYGEVGWTVLFMLGSIASFL